VSEKFVTKKSLTNLTEKRFSKKMHKRPASPPLAQESKYQKNSEFSIVDFSNEILVQIFEYVSYKYYRITFVNEVCKRFFEIWKNHPFTKATKLLSPSYILASTNAISFRELHFDINIRPRFYQRITSIDRLVLHTINFEYVYIRIRHLLPTVKKLTLQIPQINSINLVQLSEFTNLRQLKIVFHIDQEANAFIGNLLSNDADNFQLSTRSYVIDMPAKLPFLEKLSIKEDNSDFEKGRFISFDIMSSGNASYPSLRSIKADNPFSVKSFMCIPNLHILDRPPPVSRHNQTDKLELLSLKGFFVSDHISRDLLLSRFKYIKEYHIDDYNTIKNPCIEKFLERNHGNIGCVLLVVFDISDGFSYKEHAHHLAKIINAIGNIQIPNFDAVSSVVVVIWLLWKSNLIHDSVKINGIITIKTYFQKQINWQRTLRAVFVHYEYSSSIPRICHDINADHIAIFPEIENEKIVSESRLLLEMVKSGEYQSHNITLHDFIPFLIQVTLGLDLCATSKPFDLYTFFKEILPLFMHKV
jgi:hypothetical protein